jgi:hypothetical protein
MHRTIGYGTTTPECLTESRPLSCPGRRLSECSLVCVSLCVCFGIAWVLLLLLLLLCCWLLALFAVLLLLLSLLLLLLSLGGPRYQTWPLPRFAVALGLPNEGETHAIFKFGLLRCIKNEARVPSSILSRQPSLGMVVLPPLPLPSVSLEFADPSLRIRRRPQS